MKVVLFCGGLGTRLREHSDTVPKPLACVGSRPIIWHLMRYYAHYGHNEFILCLGYRGDLIREYFLRYNEAMSNDFTLSEGGRRIQLHGSDIDDWRITFVDTGLNTNVGQRLVRARRAVWLTVGYCLVVTATTAVLFLAIPRTLVGLFTADAAVIEAGALYLRIISIAQIGQSFELIFEGALAGAGYTLWPMVASTGLTALRIPLSAWWSGVFGLVGIWWALSLTAASRGVAMVLFWRGGAWKRSVV